MHFKPCLLLLPPSDIRSAAAIQSACVAPIVFVVVINSRHLNKSATTHS